MQDPRSSFKIDKVSIEVDFHQKQAVLHCETEDGTPLHLKCDYGVLEKLKEEIRKKLEAY